MHMASVKGKSAVLVGNVNESSVMTNLTNRRGWFNMNALKHDQVFMPSYTIWAAIDIS